VRIIDSIQDIAMTNCACFVTFGVNFSVTL
jgi:hypothetical protein